MNRIEPTGGGRLAVHFQSRTDLWATPWDFFLELDREFGFDLDVCAVTENAKCARYYTPEIDGLRQEWRGVCWLNPPYGREIGRWMAKALDAARQGATVVALIPARTDTGWFHASVLAGATEVRLVRGRLRFGDAPHAAPFPSAVVVFRPRQRDGVPRLAAMDARPRRAIPEPSLN